MFAQTSPAWRLLVIVEPEDREQFRTLLAADLREPRVRLIANEGRGLAGAFNTGMRAADTDFVAILLGDDLWAPCAVQSLVEAIRAHPQVDFFHSGRRVVDDAGRPVADQPLPSDAFTASDFIDRSPVKHLLCWRRTCALAIGGMDETINNIGPDDYDFPWTMLEHGAVFRALPEYLYVYRDHRSAYRLTTHLPLNVHLRELRRILTKHGVAAGQMRRRLRQAKRGYLRQCLYRNDLHRFFKALIGSSPESGWRQKRP
jgi:glycosyltransferase involved in cell wall biosynthesis